LFCIVHNRCDVIDQLLAQVNTDDVVPRDVTVDRARERAEVRNDTTFLLSREYAFVLSECAAFHSLYFLSTEC
jgi:hypothetical protein